MQEALIERIRGLGHTRLLIRPLAAPEHFLTLQECHSIVEKSAVLLRGWDLPHIHKRGNDANGARENVGEFAQHWTTWDYHVEFWRMYRSTQFLHYKVYREDLRENLPGKPDAPFLEVGWTIFFFTEVLEFLSRLVREGLYGQGCELTVTFSSTEARRLWIGDGRRMGFSHPRETHAPCLVVHRKLTSNEVLAGAKDISLDMLIEFFQHFGWEPGPEQIRIDQERLLNRQLG
ncbi:hypothetical protein DEM27_01515 [Metarhizobium album]|uniref:Uncharacterized protein n=1 Tax=Metarhizobium album TaxID=2182425 RepID=A0A2U2DX47_9HYPH|nr:hypothetical protein [Rhizobium album]PWE57898.1 hypothetical protein DEM27_01515 [Rhizobium album]